MLGKTPKNIQIMKPMKDGVIADPYVAEEMLKQFISQVAGSFVRKIVVCVPAGATEADKRIIRDSCEHAGAKSVELISEPMAAAIGLGLNVLEPEGNMIVDIGGGTTEIAVIALGGTVCNQSIKAAGNLFNQAILDYFKNEHNLLIGENEAEGIKEVAGSAHAMDKEFESQGVEVRGKDLVTGVPKMVIARNKDIRERALAAPIQEIINSIRKLLDETPPELSKDIYDKGIWVTGGGALLKGLLQRIREETNLPVQKPDEIDPLLAVVTGTGKVLEDINKYRQCLIRRTEFI
jgi:rod shape-determining protein MreB